MSDATRTVERLWDGTGFVARVGRALLTPAAGLYAVGVSVRNVAYGVGVLRSRAAAVRTVSVGNVRVGGTGKTPFTRWLAGRIQARGVAVAIVSRGYGGGERTPHVVGDGAQVTSTVARSGDETMMLARTSGVPVVAGVDRTAAAALAVETFHSRLLLCDDAFQHRALRRDLDLVLVDAGERGGLGRLLPVGPLREPLRALKRAHVILVSERDDTPGAIPKLGEHQRALRVRFAPRALVQPVHSYDTRDWHAIVGAAKDVDLIVTTEKDLVKLEAFPFARGKLVALRLGVEVEDGDDLVTQVIGAAATDVP